VNIPQVLDTPLKRDSVFQPLLGKVAQELKNLHKVGLTRGICPNQHTETGHVIHPQLFEAFEVTHLEPSDSRGMTIRFHHTSHNDLSHRVCLRY
jgi:hypothetical protein